MSKKEEIICIGCPKGCKVTLTIENDEITGFSGLGCPEGEKYVRQEHESPVRILPTTVRTEGSSEPLISVRTKRPIPKHLMTDAMNELAEVRVEPPIKMGDVVHSNLLDTGVDVIATRDLLS